ncbi:hypothetical protein [uncultured Duncaniella sp.]|uniref:hypothetical protein n=1 Tax=uncultured Duncaniella sp. TaxID=2768039 RepID=UPI0025A9D76B|nr:hypothetical protein [uncultured Duncaniella sp.]
MPELGSLWYSVGLKDLTDADIRKINDKLKNLGSDLFLNPKLAKSITEILPKGIKLELEPQLKAVSNEALAKAVEGKVMRVEIAPLLTNLRKALKDVTKDNPPEIEVGVQSAKLRTIIQNILNKQGFMLNISTVNDNYSKVVQQKLNGTRYTVKIHADAKEITRSVQASLMQVQSRAFGLQISRDILYRSIDDALGHKRFTINVAVQHDQARKAVQDALLRAQVIGKDQALAYQRLQTGELKAAQAELARLKAAHMGAADAAKAHATASINLGGALGSNIKIAGELSSAMASLYSVHAAKEFLSQVIEIGGELEHQKIAMDTIFGDKGKTSELFGQIKGLARQSPFGVMELTKSVKALSAYGVQYNEIYDTAKRLADISAATSVDINRLILAFGKTKSRGFLDGLEAKQFAYANIPIYEMVRRKLEELEGQAVTTAQVMERMKKREIGFDIVKDVLWDMTDEGGKFYNMQEALAGSVKTSWKLVRDNIELMFGEIAEGAVGSSLKSLAEILQGLTREWRTVGTVVGTAAIGLGVYKVATLGVNSAIQKSTLTTYKNIIAQKQKSAEDLKAWGRITQLNKAELMRIATANKLTNADLRQAIAEGKLTDKHIAQLFWQKKVTAEQIKHLVAIGQLNPAMAKAMLSNNRFTLSLQMMKQGLVSAGAAMKAFLLNPWTIGIAAITALMGLWQRHNEKVEATKENIKQLGEVAREGAKNLSAEVDKLNAQNPQNMVSSEFINSIEEMKNILKDYDPTWMDAFKEAFGADETGKIKSVAEQYEILKQAVIDTAEAYEELYRSKNIAYDAHETTDGLFDESLKENIKDYLDAKRKYEQKLSKILILPEASKKAVNAAMEASPEYKATVEGKPLAEQLAQINKYQQAWAAVFKVLNSANEEENKFRNMFLELNAFERNDLNPALETMQADDKTFGENLKKMYEGLYGDMEQWTEPTKKAVIMGVRDVYASAEGVAKEEADKLANQTLATVFKFKITTDFELDNSQLNDWQTELDNLTENQFTTIIRMAPDYLTALSEIQKATDEAQKQLDDAKLKMPIDIQFNGSFGMKVNEIPGYDDMSASQKDAANSMLNWLKQLAGAKAGNITPTPQKPKGGASQKDEFAESLKQRFKDIKDAWSEFQKWSKTEGREAAATRIGESGLFSTLSADKIPQTVEQYRTLVVELENELRQAGVKGTARESLLNDLLKQLLDIDKTVVDEQLKLALDKVSKEAERQLADWNLFDKIRKATGNQDLAMSIAFGMNATAETDYPSMIKQQLQKTVDAAESALSKAIPKEGESPYKVQGYTYDKLKELYDARDTDKGMQEWVAVPEDIRKAWEKANGDILKYFDQQRESVANILNEYQTLQDKIDAINAKRNLALETINAKDEKGNYILSDENARKQKTDVVNAQADWDIFRQGNDYLRFFSTIYSYTLSEAQNMGMLIEQYLNKQLQNTQISAEEYGKEMERVRQQIEKLRNVKSPFMSILTDGVGGYLNQQQNVLGDKIKADPKLSKELFDYRKREQELTEQIAQAQRDGDKDRLEALKKELQLLKDGLSDAVKGFNLSEKLTKILGDANGVMGGINNIIQGVSDAFNSIKDMADAYGFDTESNDWLNVGAVIDTFSQVSGALQAATQGDIGGIISGTIGAITAPFTIWSKLHDKKLQKMIERSKEAAQIMQNQYDILEKRMANFLGNAANMKVEGYSGEGGAYGKQRELMQGQLAELEKQRQAEIDKKKTDDSVVADYDKQIEEMKIAVRDFAIEAANALYGIDLNGWAEQLGDSLVEAFAAGEDAAEAFDKTVGDIMRDVTSKMISQDILAPMFGDLRNFLFGENGMGGAFGADFKLDASEMAAMKTYLDKIKDEGIPAAEELFNAINEATGGILNETDTAKSGLSAGIQSVTEDTADLLASYLNAIRADVAMQTGSYWTRLLDDALPQMNVIAQSQLDTQRQIAENTLRNAVAAEAIMKSNDDISRLLARVTQGGAKFYVN